MKIQKDTCDKRLNYEVDFSSFKFFPFLICRYRPYLIFIDENWHGSFHEQALDRKLFQPNINKTVSPALDFF